MLLAYLGQYVRSNLQDAFCEVDTKAVEVPKEVLHIMIFMDQLCGYSSIPKSVVYKFIPPYIFDSLKLMYTMKK